MSAAEVLARVHHLVEVHRSAQPSPYSDKPPSGGRPQATAAAPADPFSWVSASSLAEPLPPVPWVVPELQIGPGRPCSIQSYGAGMKSLAVGALAVAAAAGRPVWGWFRVPAPRRIRIWDYEMGRRAWARRLQRLALGLDVDLASLPLELAALPRLRLTDMGARDAYMRAAEGVELGIVDSFRAAARGADENDSNVREYLDLLLEVSEQTGIAWIVLHHVGKAKDGHDDARQKGRGASAIFDAWGSVLDLTRESDSVRLVTMTKPHPEAAGPVEPFYLEVEDVLDGADPKAGVVVRYRTVEQVHPPEAAGDAIAGDVERVVRALAAEGQSSSIDAIAGLAGMRLTAGRRAVRLALDRGRIVQLGTARQPLYRVCEETPIPPGTSDVLGPGRAETSTSGGVDVRDVDGTSRDVGTST